MTPDAERPLPRFAQGALYRALPGSRRETYWIQQFRDLTLVGLPGGLVQVLACDSNASIGEKPNDALAKPHRATGFSAAKVPLMEVLASGASPLILVDVLCVEWDPSGREILEGIRASLASISLDIPIITGSTEDNMRTTQTGVGIVVLGIARTEDLRLACTPAQSEVLAVGVPHNGASHPYQEDDPDIARLSTVMALRQLADVHEILPVGSHGAAHELRLLAETNGLQLVPSRTSEFPLHESAGASTCVLATAPRGYAARVERHTGLPVTVVGTLAGPSTG